MPDAIRVISAIASQPGLFLATGFQAMLSASVQGLGN